MTDRNETLDRLIEAARLLGITQAKKGYGIYTIADGKVEGALYESIDTLSQALTQPEIPMSPEHLPQYIATNNIKPTTEGGGGAGGAQPEHRFDTPESHIVKWSIPVDPNNFGEPLAQPEQVVRGGPALYTTKNQESKHD